MKDIIKLNITQKAVLLRMGMNVNVKINDKLDLLIEEAIENSKKLIDPKYAVSFTDIKIEEKKIIIDDFAIDSKDIFDLLKNCSKIYGFIATAGAKIDEKVNLLQDEKELTSSYIYDAIGSVAIENLASNIHNHIKDVNEKENFLTTMRFSPGYGDFSLENQKKFLLWLGADKAGVTLSETFQMSPRKSVSAILGVYPKNKGA